MSFIERYKVLTEQERVNFKRDAWDKIYKERGGADAALFLEEMDALDKSLEQEKYSDRGQGQAGSNSVIGGLGKEVHEEIQPEPEENSTRRETGIIDSIRAAAKPDSSWDDIENDPILGGTAPDIRNISEDPSKVTKITSEFLPSLGVEKPEIVDSNLNANPQLGGIAPDISTNRNSGNIRNADPEKQRREWKESGDYGKAWMAGLNHSVIGQDEKDIKEVKEYVPPKWKWNELSLENLDNLSQNLTYTGATALADLPFFLVGGALGAAATGGTPYGAFAGAMALHSGAREYVQKDSTAESVAGEAIVGGLEGTVSYFAGKGTGALTRKLTQKIASGFANKATKAATGHAISEGAEQAIGAVSRGFGNITDELMLNWLLVYSQALRHNGGEYSAEDVLINITPTMGIKTATKMQSKVVEKYLDKRRPTIVESQMFDVIKEIKDPIIKANRGIMPMVEHYYKRGRSVEESAFLTKKNIVESLDFIEKHTGKKPVGIEQAMGNLDKLIDAKVEEMFHANNDFSVNMASRNVDMVRASKNVKEGYRLDDLKLKEQQLLREKQKAEGAISGMSERMKESADHQFNVGMEEIRKDLRTLANRKTSSFQYISKYAKSDAELRLKLDKVTIAQDVFSKELAPEAFTHYTNFLQTPDYIIKQLAKNANLWGGDSAKLADRIYTFIFRNTGNKGTLFEDFIGKDFVDLVMPAVNEAELLNHVRVNKFNKYWSATQAEFIKKGGNSKDVMMHIINKQLDSEGNLIGPTIIQLLKDEKRLDHDYVVKQAFELSDVEAKLVGQIKSVMRDTLHDLNESRRIMGLKEIKGVGEDYIPLASTYANERLKHNNTMDDAAYNGWKLAMQDALAKKKAGTSSKYLHKRLLGAVDDMDLDPFSTVQTYQQHMARKITHGPVAGIVCKMGEELKKRQPMAGEYVIKTSKYWLGEFYDDAPYWAKKLLGKVNKNLQTTLLCNNISTTITQMTALDIPIAEFGINNVLKSVEFIDKNGFSYLTDNCPELATRVLELTPEVLVGLSDTSFTAKITEMGMSPMIAMDHLAAGITVKTAFEHYRKTMSDSDAWIQAGKYMNKTQATASRFYNADIYSSAWGKAVGTLQTYVFNRFHYLVSETMGIKPVYEHIRNFKNLEDAYAFKKGKKGYVVQELRDGTAAVYDKAAVKNYVKRVYDFGKLMVVHTAMNMGYGLLSSGTGLDINSPFPDLINAAYEEYNGISLYDAIYGHPYRKNSRLSDGQRVWRVGARMAVEGMKSIPVAGSWLGFGNAFGPAVGTVNQVGSDFVRGFQKGDPVRVIKAGLRVSALTTRNPLYAISMTTLRSIEKKHRKEELRHRALNKRSIYKTNYKTKYKTKY